MDNLLSSIPLPADAVWITKMLAWTLGLCILGLFSMSLILIKIFIGKQKALGTIVEAHTTKLDDVAFKVEAASSKMIDATVEIKTSNLNFQQGMLDSLTELKKDSMEIETSLGRTRLKADELEAKIDTVNDKMSTTLDQVVAFKVAMKSAATKKSWADARKSLKMN